MWCGANPWHSRGGRGHARDPWGFHGFHPDIDGGMRGAHRDRRAAHLRHMCRMRDVHRGRRSGGPLAYLFCYWWLIFPVVFWIVPSLQRADWGRIGLTGERAATGWLDASPVSWFVDFFARATGMSASDAGAILLLALIVNSLTVVIALRLPAGRARA